MPAVGDEPIVGSKNDQRSPESLPIVSLQRFKSSKSSPSRRERPQRGGGDRSAIAPFPLKAL
jgi:hypothetical protein